MSASPSRFAELPNHPAVAVIRRVTEVVTVLVIAVYLVLITVQVFFRYALNDSITWSEELVQFLLLWGVMLGSAVAADRQAHIALDPLRDRLSAPAYRIVEIMAALCTIGFCLVLIWYGIRFMGRVGAMTAAGSDLPMVYVYAAMPVGSALIAFFVLVHLIAATPPPDLRVDETA